MTEKSSRWKVSDEESFTIEQYSRLEKFVTKKYLAAEKVSWWTSFVAEESLRPIKLRDG